MKKFNGFIIEYWNSDKPLSFRVTADCPKMYRFTAVSLTTVTASTAYHSKNRGGYHEETSLLQKGDYFELFNDAPDSNIRHKIVTVVNGEVLVF